VAISAEIILAASEVEWVLSLPGAKAAAVEVLLDTWQIGADVVTGEALWELVGSTMEGKSAGQFKSTYVKLGLKLYDKTHMADWHPVHNSRWAPKRAYNVPPGSEVYFLGN
jgi:hypothetical protein